MQKTKNLIPSLVIAFLIASAWLWLTLIVASNMTLAADPIQSLTINGPSTGVTNLVYTFTAEVSPPTTTLPITYTWFPEPISGQGSNAAFYEWTSTGLHVVSIIAQNDASIYTTTHPISISDSSPAVRFSQSTYSVNEAAGQAEVQVKLSHNPYTDTYVTVNYETSDDTATHGADYTAVSGTLIFSPSQTSVIFNVPIIQDSLVEGAETIHLTLSTPDQASLGFPDAATLTIEDDDGPQPTLVFSDSAYSVLESAGEATFVVLLSENPYTMPVITVDYFALTGTATAGEDFAPLTGTLVFSAGQTGQYFNITILDDTLVEEDEFVTVILDNAQNATLGSPHSTLLTIIDDESPGDPNIQFSGSHYSVNEGNSEANITVTLSNPSTDTVASVNYTTQPESATPGEDYAPVTGTLSFSSSETIQAFTLPIYEDNFIETHETLKLLLSNPVNAQLGVPAEATLTIEDNETSTVPTVQFDEEAYSVTEGVTTAALTVTLSHNPYTSTSTWVNYFAISGTATPGEDYDLVSGTLYFDPGETIQPLLISILDDALSEETETVLVFLEDAYQATLGVPSLATLTILDDETVEPVTLAIQKSVTPTTQVPLSGTVLYSLNLDNTGTVTTTNVVLTDPLPSAVSFSSWALQSGAIISGNVIHWSRSLYPDEQVSIQFYALVGTETYLYGQTIQNMAYYTVNDSESGAAQATFTVEPAPVSPHFTVDVQPPQANVTPGAATTHTITLTPYANFAASITLTVTQIPSATTATLIPETVVPTGTASLHIQTSSNTPHGQHEIILQAAGGGITTTIPITLDIQPSPTAPSPQVHSVSPSRVSNHQSNQLTIRGVNFGATPQVNVANIRLSNVIFAGTTEIKAALPTNFVPGVHDVRVTNPDGQTGTLTRGLTVTAPSAPEVAYITPQQGFNTVPVVLNIWVTGLTDEVTITLHTLSTTIPLVNVARTSTGQLRATVPANHAPGAYTLTVATATGADSVSNAYTILDPETDILDVYATSSDLWINPPAVRKGNRITLGVNIAYRGTESHSTTVSFRTGSPTGPQIGTQVSAILTPNHSCRVQVPWTFTATGMHVIYAILDPENTIPETPVFAERNNIISRTFTILPPTSDTQPPTVLTYTIHNDASVIKSTETWFDLYATESLSGTQSGLANVLYEEFEYNQGAEMWTLVQKSEWLHYASAHHAYVWTLVNSHGMRFARAWVADAVGNISILPGTDFVNYISDVAPIADGAVTFYRQYLEVGEEIHITLNPVSGDPDLYVWAPSWTQGAWHSTNESPLTDSLTIQAQQTGYYQIEVYGYTAATYKLSINVMTTPSTKILVPPRSLKSPTEKVLRTAPVIDPGSVPDGQTYVPDPPPLAQYTGVAISHGRNVRVSPDTIYTYIHAITNTGDGLDYYNLTTVSAHDWPVTLIGESYPQGTNILPIPLGAGQAVSFTLKVNIPLSATTGTADHITVTATSTTSPTVQATAIHTLIVQNSYMVYLPLLMRH